MGMKDPLPTFTAFVERIRDAHPNFAYIHVIEHRAKDASDALRKIWGDRPYIAAGGFDRTSAISTVEKHGGLIAFGRHFISNVRAFFITHQLETNLTITLKPDLPLRLKEGIELTPYNTGTFYSPEAAAGYVDYPFATEVVPVRA